MEDRLDPRAFEIPLDLTLRSAPVVLNLLVLQQRM